MQHPLEILVGSVPLLILVVVGLLAGAVYEILKGGIRESTTLTAREHKYLCGLRKGLWILLVGFVLGGCALHHPPVEERVCVVTPCGDTCCNDDQQVCPTCWETGEKR